jgi:hypothetical protein
LRYSLACGSKTASLLVMHHAAPSISTSAPEHAPLKPTETALRCARIAATLPGTKGCARMSRRSEAEAAVLLLLEVRVVAPAPAVAPAVVAAPLAAEADVVAAGTAAAVATFLSAGAAVEIPLGLPLAAAGLGDGPTPDTTLDESQSRTPGCVKASACRALRDVSSGSDRAVRADSGTAFKEEGDAAPTAAGPNGGDLGSTKLTPRPVVTAAGGALFDAVAAVLGALFAAAAAAAADATAAAAACFLSSSALEKKDFEKKPVAVPLVAAKSGAAAAVDETAAGATAGCSCDGADAAETVAAVAGRAVVVDGSPEGDEPAVLGNGLVLTRSSLDTVGRSNSLMDSLLAAAKEDCCRAIPEAVTDGDAASGFVVAVVVVVNVEAGVLVAGAGPPPSAKFGTTIFGCGCGCACGLAAGAATVAAAPPFPLPFVAAVVDAAVAAATATAAGCFVPSGATVSERSTPPAAGPRGAAIGVACGSDAEGEALLAGVAV